MTVLHRGWPKMFPFVKSQLAPTLVTVVTLGIVLGTHCCGGTPIATGFAGGGGFSGNVFTAGGGALNGGPSPTSRILPASVLFTGGALSGGCVSNCSVQATSLFFDYFISPFVPDIS